MSSKDVDEQGKRYRKKKELSQRLEENKINIPFSLIKLGHIIGRLHIFLRPGKTTPQLHNRQNPGVQQEILSQIFFQQVLPQL